MNRFILLTVLLCLLGHDADVATAWDDKDFFSYCPPQQYGNGPEIWFPLWIESSNTSSPSCGGATCTKLVCSSNDTILLLDPILGASKVITVDYKNATMKIIPVIGYSSVCPIQELTEPVHSEDALTESVHSEDALTESVHSEDGRDYSYDLARLVDCSRKFTLSEAQLRNSYGGGADLIAGPIPCLSSNPGRFTYLVRSDLPLYLLPSDCKLVSKRAVHIPYAYRSPST
ncbi:Rust resistance kinase Lr10, partial [Dichanthelium oligosanthes]